MGAAARQLAVGVLLTGIASGCGTAGPGALPTAAPLTSPEQKFGPGRDLECEGGQMGAGVNDYAAGAVGQPTPEQAAREQLDLDGIDPQLLTETTSTDATGSTFVEYRNDDGRLVLYVEPEQTAGGTWLATHVYACADLSG